MKSEITIKIAIFYCITFQGPAQHDAFITFNYSRAFWFARTLELKMIFCIFKAAKPWRHWSITIKDKRPHLLLKGCIKAKITFSSADASRLSNCCCCDKHWQIWSTMISTDSAAILFLQERPSKLLSQQNHNFNSFSMKVQGHIHDWLIDVETNKSKLPAV